MVGQGTVAELCLLASPETAHAHRMSSSPAPSYYRATATPYAPFSALQGKTEARVAIIGGGFAGLHTALGLAERGIRDVVVLEREQVGFGASGRNGGLVFAGYSLREQAL